MYSSSKNVLTGVIESQETLENIARVFCKTLVWYIVKHCVSHGLQDAPINKAPAKTSDSKGPVNEDSVIPIGKLKDTYNPSSLQDDLRPSSSIEAVNLNSWPSTANSSPEHVKDRLANSQSSGWRSRIQDNDFEDENVETIFEMPPTTPLKRKGLLPPLKNQYLINNDLPSQGEISDNNNTSDIFTFPIRSLADSSNNFDEGGTVSTLTRSFSEQCLEKILDNDQKTVISGVSYTNIIKAVIQCLKVVYGLEIQDDLSGLKNSAVVLGPKTPVKVFEGKLNQSVILRLLSDEGSETCHKIIVPAMRYATKLAIDQAVAMLDFDLNLDDKKNTDMLIDFLEDMDHQWYLGKEDEDGWKESVKNEIPNLFSVGLIGREITGRPKPTFRSQLLTLRECQVSVGRINSEVIRSLWASLVFELLYLTNDDDERYSIQAEERILRNLSVEAANPPLGYAVYTSPYIRLLMHE